MNALEKRRKWLTWKAFMGCLFLSAGVLIVATIYEFAKNVVTSNLPMLEKTGYLILMWILLACLLLVYGLLSPELMEAVFKMLGYKEKERQEKETVKPKKPE